MCRGYIPTPGIIRQANPQTFADEFHQVAFARIYEEKRNLRMDVTFKKSIGYEIYFSDIKYATKKARKAK